MQGRKNYTEKLFLSFRLSDRIPGENFYRRLRETLDLSFLYKDTKELYGKTGNPSIDPVVFFKLLITGYLENITSDRKLVEHCSMRMDVLYFLGFDIDEDLPWHSTISSTRQLYPESLFEKLFNKVFALCVDSGMVSGHTQAVDSAPIKANASMESVVPNTKCKKITRTIYDEQYLRAYARQHSERGKRIKKLRQSTVEPVFGSLTQFYGLRKIGVLGKAGAHKVMLMAAIAFNLKKYLKKGGRRPSIGIFRTIMDAFKGCLTIFLRQIQSRPVLIEAP